MPDLPYRASAFGVLWRSDIPLPGYEAVPPDGVNGDAAIAVRRTDRLPERGRGKPVNRGFVYPDGIRFGWEREVAFDMVDGDRIAYAPGHEWTGEMPASFYSTVAALTIAWRGMVPLHACAVEQDGRALLIAGPAGAGKSTLAAGLVAEGAGFIADDLAVVTADGDGRVNVLRGRPTMRLHANTAALLDADEAHPIAGDPRGKWLVRPTRRSTADRIEVSAILLLEGNTLIPSAPSVRLSAHLFRRQWIGQLPMGRALMAELLALGAEVPTLAFPAQGEFNPTTWRKRAVEAGAIARASLRHRRGDTALTRQSPVEVGES